MAKRYGSTWALQGVSLSLGQGFHVLVGPNGSGKTTLLKILAGLSRPSRGSVKVLGRDPYRDQGIRSTVSYVPERLYLPPGLRVRDAVEAWGSLPGWSWSKFEEFSGTLGLDFMDKRIGELSEGMRQKLSLAFFLGRKPRVILADEPTANLDPPSRLRVILGLRKEAERGALVLVATHSLYETMLAADTMIALMDGRVGSIASISSLASKASFKARVRGEIPEELLGEPWIRSLGGGVYLIEAPSMVSMLERLVSLAERGRLVAVDPILPGLEEAYGGGWE